MRLPDVCFVSWARLPGRKLPAGAIANLVSDLAVEILSPSDTKSEMDRNRLEYFAAGVRMVWKIDRTTKTAESFTSPDQKTEIASDGVLSGGDVLPGFTLALPMLFARAGEWTD